MTTRSWSTQAAALLLFVGAAACSSGPLSMTKTVAVSEMCGAENVGRKVRVVGLVGVSPAGAESFDKPDGKTYDSFYLLERSSTAEESQEEVRRTGKLQYPAQRVLLEIGMTETTQILVLEPFRRTRVKTESGEVVAVGERLAFTGTVVPVAGTRDGTTNACQLEDVTVEKP